MDPATITAVAIGCVSFVSALGAVLVALCRKQKNEANQVKQSISADSLTAKVGEGKKVTKKYKDGTEETTETYPSIEVYIVANDIGKDDKNAANISAGFEKNTVQVPDNQKAVTGTTTSTSTSAIAAVTSSASKPSGEVASSSNAVSAVTEEKVSHPPLVNHEMFGNSSSTGNSVYDVKHLHIKTPNGTIFEMEGFHSDDTTRSRPYVLHYTQNASTSARTITNTASSNVNSIISPPDSALLHEDADSHTALLRNSPDIVASASLTGEHSINSSDA